LQVATAPYLVVPKHIRGSFGPRRFCLSQRTWPGGNFLAVVDSIYQLPWRGFLRPTHSHPPNLGRFFYQTFEKNDEKLKEGADAGSLGE
jgi:hypothetical protein